MYIPHNFNAIAVRNEISTFIILMQEALLLCTSIHCIQVLIDKEESEINKMLKEKTCSFDQMCLKGHEPVLNIKKRIFILI
jgi:hypothetical protein